MTSADGLRTQDAEARAAQQHRAILDAIPAIAWCKLPDGSNEFVNQRWQDFTGISADEARGQGWQAAVHPEDLPKLIDRWAEIVASGQGGEFEGRLRRHDGAFRWVVARFEPVRDDAGEIVRWYGISTDIDALKQAEEKLREDERALRRITDAIPQQIVILDPDGRPIYANQATLDYTGLTMADVVRADFRARIFHADDLERVRDQRQAALAAGVPFEFELRGLSKQGPYRWFLIRYKPFHDEHGRLVSWYATGTDIDERKRAEERIRSENVALREEIDRSAMFEEIVGSSDALRHLLAQVAKVAPTDSTVLISGETGTGKELIARAIHRRSPRAARAFIRVNCAAIAPSLIASELFGHEKGAFTGALQRRVGRFEAADGGTIFLDEVGELPVEMQLALLRVLQEREFERVGSNQPISVDVRVLAATNRDLQAAVTAGTFREDLFYRLNVVPIQVPPLRERMDDLPVLVEYLVTRYAEKVGRRIGSVERRTVGAASGLWLAREHPGAAERHRTGGDPVRGRHAIHRRSLAEAGRPGAVTPFEPTQREPGSPGPGARERSDRSRAGRQPGSGVRTVRRGGQTGSPASDARVKDRQPRDRQTPVPVRMNC